MVARLKTCSRCKAEKPEASFAKSAKYKDGLFTWCKTCTREYHRKRKADLKKDAPDVEKKCPYCGGLYPADQFVKMKKGRGGRSTVIMCRPCYDARKNPETSKKRLEEIVERQKAELRREFNPFYMEKN